MGATAYPGRTLIELPDLSLMDVKLQVHQADVRKLRKGLPAMVTFPDKSAGKQMGTVTEIGSIAQSSSWRDPVKRFDLVVQLNDRVQGFRAGVTVEVEIDLGDLEDVLYVPLQAVASTGSGFSVFVREDGETRRRRVALGRSNEQYVQVLEGLDRLDRGGPRLGGASGHRHLLRRGSPGRPVARVPRREDGPDRRASHE